MSEKLETPSGWSNVKLGDLLLAVIGGGTPSRKVPHYFVGDIPWFTVKDMKALRPNDAEEHISEVAIADSATNLIPSGTLLVATRIALGRAIRPTVACAINQDLKALILGKGVDPDYLLHWIGANERVIQGLGSGTTVSGIRLEALHGLPISLPPTKEQSRIVSKLEELLSDLDAGVAELKTAQSKLAQYRQSLLKAAVEGQLTAEWRANRKSKPGETGAELLQRILRERRARWEARQLAKFAEQGKEPPKEWQTKYPEPIALDNSKLPELPKGWAWASVDQLSATVRNGLSQKPSAEPCGYPILRINAVRTMAVNLAEVRYLDISDDEASDYLLENGDLLATRYNGSVDLLGVFGVVRGLATPTVHPDKLIRIKPVLENGLADWMEVCASTGESRKHVVSRVKTTAGQTGVSGDDIKKMPIPLPPMLEQTLALEMLSVSLGEMVNQLSTVNLALKQSTAQRKNILKAAFSGQLVPQDPTDEPAGVLLERIRAQRASPESDGPRRSRKARMAA